MVLTFPVAVFLLATTFLHVLLICCEENLPSPYDRSNSGDNASLSFTEHENALPPVTKEPFYHVSIAEDAPLGAHLLILEAHDRVFAGRNDEMELRFRITNDELPFSIESKTGVIKIKSELDRELESQYVIDVEISATSPNENGGETTLMTRTPITVDILDVNDNTPYAISPIYRCQAFNNLSPSVPICQIVVVDKDAGDNGDLTFSITEGNEAKHFVIDEKSGAIYLKENGMVPSFYYVLIVAVSDNGIPQKSENVRVLLKILGNPNENNRENSTNHAPVFDKFDQRLRVDENEVVGYVITSIKASDEDGDRLCYHILSGNIDNAFAFTESGVLLLAKQLDYERRTHYNLTIMVTDGVGTAQTSVSVSLCVCLNSPFLSYLESTLFCLLFFLTSI